MEIGKEDEDEGEGAEGEEEQMEDDDAFMLGIGTELNNDVNAARRDIHSLCQICSLNSINYSFPIGFLLVDRFRQ